MHFLYEIQSALPEIKGKADSFLIPCPFKYLTQLDCPGCGFQRSVIALLHGNLQESFSLYPPAILFLVSLMAGVSAMIFKVKPMDKFLKVLYIATGIIMVVNYCYKILTHQLY